MYATHVTTDNLLIHIYLYIYIAIPTHKYKYVSMTGYIQGSPCVDTDSF